MRRPPAPVLETTEMLLTRLEMDWIISSYKGVFEPICTGLRDNCIMAWFITGICLMVPDCCNLPFWWYYFCMILRY